MDLTSLFGDRALQRTASNIVREEVPTITLPESIFNQLNDNGSALIAMRRIILRGDLLTCVREGDTETFSVIVTESVSVGGSSTFFFRRTAEEVDKAA